MAKPSKSDRSDRQKVIDDIRRKQKGAEKRQGMIIVVVCVAVAAAIILAAAWGPLTTAYQKQKYSGTPLNEIGAAADVCGKVTEKEATGNQEHVPEDQQVNYPDSPPAFGAHWNAAGIAPTPEGDRFYTKSTRPELEALVHNLEHGYTILWYDESIADDSAKVGTIKALAAKLDANDTNGRLKFKAAPWTSEDGAPFPDGQHVAFTHWRMSAEQDAATQGQKQYGVWMYCSEPSGAALEKFMSDYPFTDAPEPWAA